MGFLKQISELLGPLISDISDPWNMQAARLTAIKSAFGLYIDIL